MISSTNEKYSIKEETDSASSKPQTNIELQSLIDMCTKKLEQDPNHKKALLLRASSYIKKNELERVK